LNAIIFFGHENEALAERFGT